MKTRLILLALSLLCIVPSFCVADTIPAGDPRVQSGGSNGSIPVFTTNFSFILVIPGPGKVISPTFSNMSGGTIFKVTITPQFGAYTTGNVGNSCGFSVYFSSCTFPGGNNGSWTFFGLPGIPQHDPQLGGGEFDFSFFGFNTGTFTINGTLDLTPPATIPEPGTLLLIGPVLAGLWTKRRKFIGV